VRVTPVDDGVTLLDVRRGTVHHVNRAGAVILAALTDTGITRDVGISGAAAVDTAAAAALVARYGIPAERARADVAVLLDQLRAHGLLTR
jgi:hypothetical protein